MLLRPIEPEQYLAIRYTERLAAEGAVNSVGGKGDSYDNALAESINSLYKSELITMRGPWRSVADVELATCGWVHWFNTERILWPLGGMSPAEYEARWLDRPENQPPGSPLSPATPDWYQHTAPIEPARTGRSPITRASTKPGTDQFFGTK